MPTAGSPLLLEFYLNNTGVTFPLEKLTNGLSNEICKLW